MHDPWTHLREAFDRAMVSLEKKEAVLARTHLKAAEHTAHSIGTHAKGDERERAGKIYLAVQKAEKTIDPLKALELLKAAHAAFTGAPPPKPHASPPAPTPPAARP